MTATHVYAGTAASLGVTLGGVFLQAVGEGRWERLATGLPEGHRRADDLAAWPALRPGWSGICPRPRASPQRGAAGGARGDDAGCDPPTSEFAGINPASGEMIPLEKVDVDHRVMQISCFALVERTMGKAREYDPTSEKPVTLDLNSRDYTPKQLDVIKWLRYGCW